MNEFNDDLERYIQKRHIQENVIEDKIKKKRVSKPIKISFNVIEFFYDKPETIYNSELGTEIINKRKLKIHRLFKRIFAKKELKNRDYEKENQDFNDDSKEFVEDYEKEIIQEENSQDSCYQEIKKPIFKRMFGFLFSKSKETDYVEDDDTTLYDDLEENLVISRDDLRDAFKIANSLIKKLSKDEIARFKSSESYNKYYDVMEKLDLVRK